MRILSRVSVLEARSMQGSNAIVTEQMPRGGWEVALKSPHQEQPNPGMQITQYQAGVKVKTKIQWEEADPSGHGRHWVGGGPPLTGGQESQCQACSCVGICLVSRVHLRAGTDNDKLEFSPLNISIVTDGGQKKCLHAGMVLHLNPTTRCC